MLSGVVLLAQTVHTDYFLRNSQTRYSMNPAFRPDQGYLGVPFFSDFSIGIYTNAFKLNNWIFERNGEYVTFLHPSVSSDEFLSNIPDRSYADFSVNYKIFTLGFYDRNKGFWTVDLGFRSIGDVSVPKQLAELAKLGFSKDESKSVDYLIRNVQASATAYMETGVGYSKSLMDNQLQIGGKVKFLFGIGNVNLNVEQLDISTYNGEWTARSKASLDLSTKSLEPKYKDTGMFDGFDFDLKKAGLSGFGMGFDIGGVYRLLDNKAGVSLAFTDIGFISWSESSSKHLKSPETEIRITPVSGNIEGGNSLNEQINSVKDDLQEAINFKESGSGGRTTSLRTNMNIGFEYEVWEKNLSVGLLSATYFNHGNTLSEVTLSANYNPVDLDWLSGALSYSFVHGNMGLALHLTPRKGVSFFVASDFLFPHVNKDFILTSSKAINIQFGFAIPLGKRIE
jgi:hypothetical protein